MACPTPTDDNGDGQSGTIIDEAFVADICDAITDVQTSSNDVLAEVIDARGSKSSLDARLDVSINEDGSLKQASVQGLIGLASGLNLLGNDTFLCWPNGDALTPAYWALSGVGATIARTGTGLADTARKHGRYAAKVVSGAFASGVLKQTLVSSTDMAFATLTGRKIAFGCRVKAAVAGAVSVRMTDGVNTVSSDFHSGQTTTGPENDGWEWLTGVLTVATGATEISFQCQVDPGGSAVTAYFSGPTVIFDEIEPVDWMPALITRKTFHFFQSGNATATARKAIFNVERPGMIRNTTITVQTAPVGQALIVDVNVHDNAGNLTSIYAGSGTQPTIAATAFAGSALPDGTYSQRCITTQGGTALLQGGRVSIDVDQVGSVAAGADLAVTVMYESWNRPLDELLLS